MAQLNPRRIKPQSFKERMFAATVDMGNIFENGISYPYRVVKRSFGPPNLPNFVGCAEGRYLFISEETPPRFRKYVMLHEALCTTVWKGEPGRCVRATQIEISRVPVELRPRYIQFRLKFYKDLIAFYEPYDADELKGEINASYRLLQQLSGTKVNPQMPKMLDNYLNGPDVSGMSTQKLAVGAAAGYGKRKAAKIGTIATVELASKMATKVGTKGVAKVGAEGLAKFVPVVGEAIMAYDAAPEAWAVGKEQVAATKKQLQDLKTAKGLGGKAGVMWKGAGGNLAREAAAGPRIVAAAFIGSDAVKMARTAMTRDPDAVLTATAGVVKKAAQEEAAEIVKQGISAAVSAAPNPSKIGLKPMFSDDVYDPREESVRAVARGTGSWGLAVGHYAGKHSQAEIIQRSWERYQDVDHLIRARHDYEKMLGEARNYGIYRATQEPTRNGIKFFVWPLIDAQPKPVPLQTAREAEAEIQRRVRNHIRPAAVLPTRQYTAADVADWLPPDEIFSGRTRYKSRVLEREEHAAKVARAEAVPTKLAAAKAPKEPTLLELYRQYDIQWFKHQDLIDAFLRKELPPSRGR